MRRSLGLAISAGLSAALLLGACAPADEAGTSPGGTAAEQPGRFDVDIDVATPELRRLRDAAGIEPCPASDAPPVADGMPEITLPCLGGGGDVALSSLRGPLVVNLWASWCGPCREELPYYQQLHERGRGTVAVLGVDYEDTQPDMALTLAKETGVTFPSVADPGGALRVPFRVRALPGIVMVDERGAVVHQEFAVIESFDQLADLVEEHLGVSVGGAG